MPVYRHPVAPLLAHHIEYGVGQWNIGEAAKQVDEFSDETHLFGRKKVVELRQLTRFVQIPDTGKGIERKAYLVRRELSLEHQQRRERVLRALNITRLQDRKSVV